MHSEYRNANVLSLDLYRCCSLLCKSATSTTSNRARWSVTISYSGLARFQTPRPQLLQKSGDITSHRSNNEFPICGRTWPRCATSTSLQAESTQKCRQRQKAKQDIKTTNHQAESSRTVEPVAENVQTEPEDSSLANTGEFGPDEISFAFWSSNFAVKSKPHLD